MAGHLRLSNLCWIYDSNRVTIEGHTDIAFTEDVAARFLAYGWNVLRVTDANDIDLLEQRLSRPFCDGRDRPTLIIVHSHIGYGAPHKQDSPEAHGEPLGEEEVRLTKEFFGFDPDAGLRGSRRRARAFRRTTSAHAAPAEQRVAGDVRALPRPVSRSRRSDRLHRASVSCRPDGKPALPEFPPSATGLSTRDASGKVLNAVAERMPWIVGGAADLAPSTKTRLTFDFAGDFQADGRLGDYRGRNMHFGVREHAMCAAVNGMTLTGMRAFGSGFLIFTDYARGAIRLASLMDLPVLHIWTHDSISVGEDGPTHQPIEQMVSLRAIPGMIVIRPADANEMTEAYRFILQLQNRPAALICSRQALPIVDRTQFAPASRTGARAPMFWSMRRTACRT